MFFHLPAKSGAGSEFWLCWPVRLQPELRTCGTAFQPTPSEADIRLAEGVRILQINMLDHVIVGQSLAGGPGYFSFRVDPCSGDRTLPV